MTVALAPDLRAAAIGPGRRAVLRAVLVTTAVLVGAATVGGLVLHAVNRGSVLAPGLTDFWLLSAVTAVAFGGTGTWLANRRPSMAVGWVLLAVGTGWALALLANEYAVAAFDGGRPGPALAGAALWVGSWVWAAALVAVAAVLPFLLPEGRLPSVRWRWPFRLAIVALVVETAEWAVTPYEIWAPSLAERGITNPVGMAWAANGAVTIPVTALVVASVAAAVASLAARWRAATGERRQQLKWIAFGLALTLLLFALGFVLGPGVTALAALPLPAACLAAGLRLGLWDVDVVISRSVVYGVLTAGVVAVYAAVVGVAGTLTGRTTGAPVLATAVVALAAEPTLRRLRAAVNRRVHGDPDEPHAGLARLGARLEAAHDATTVGERVLPELVDAIARSLPVPWAAVRLADGLVIGVAGEEPAESVPLLYGDREVGALVVGQRPGAPLRRADRRILARLARQAAVAAHGVLATREVQRSRELLVSAREEERRRLHQDLHDGLGPSLAALVLQVETARDLVAADPAQAGAILDRALPRLKGAVGDVRSVVNGLRPPALDDLGLAGALRELAGRFSGPRLAVEATVEAGLEELPAAVEVAAYRIAAEALANVARHAGASRAAVRVQREGDAVRVAVTDDGHGLAPGASGGVGLASMRERAAELGGTLRVSCPPGGGTEVAATLPVPAG